MGRENEVVEDAQKAGESDLPDIPSLADDSPLNNYLNALNQIEVSVEDPVEMTSKGSKDVSSPPGKRRRMRKVDKKMKVALRLEWTRARGATTPKDKEILRGLHDDALSTWMTQAVIQGWYEVVDTILEEKNEKIVRLKNELISVKGDNNELYKRNSKVEDAMKKSKANFVAIRQQLSHA
ncbi:hypothetical protein Dimus_022414 [Dionaea muscipula]